MEMAQGRVMEQMVDFQKSTFDSTYDSMATLQKQGRKLVDMTMDQNPWFPDNGKKIINQWSDVAQKNRDELKSLMDNNFSRMRDCFFHEETAKASPAADASKETAAPKKTGAKQADTTKTDKASKTDAGTKKK